MSDASWEPVVALCDRVIADLPRLAERSVRSIRRDLAVYKAVSVEEHVAAVTEQQRRRLEALAEHRLLTAADLERAAELARRRARQGIPVDVLIGAYHLGDQELWDALCRDPGTAAPLLPDVAALMLKLLHAISTVLAAAHADVSRELQSHRVTLSQRLVELVSGDAVGPEAARLADALGMNPEGDFVAAMWRPQGPEVPLPPEIWRGLDAAGVPLVHSAHAGVIVLVVQGVGSEWVAELVDRLRLGGEVGIGLRRTGLAGAAASLGDARLAMSSAHGNRRVVRFAGAWAESCVAIESARLEPLLARASSVAVAHPHLADTVVAFAAADMSVARVAVNLHLHANSVTYRLQRWAQLSGWDPRTFDGLTRSLAACRAVLRGSSR